MRESAACRIGRDLGSGGCHRGPVELARKDIHLDRRIAEKRVFPSININRSGTRREELLTSPAELNKVWILRKILHSMDELAAMEFVLGKFKDTKTNAEFFESMKKG